RAGRPSRVVYAGGPGNISERPITIISEEVVRSQAGDIEVIETIVIIIADRGAHSPAHVADTGLVRYIGKCPVAVVVIERAPGFPAGLHQVYAQRVDEVDARIAIVIVIEGGAPAAHRLDKILFFRRGHVSESDTGLLSNICKANRLGRTSGHRRYDSQQNNESRYESEVTKRQSWLPLMKIMGLPGHEPSL